ncbi:MAG: hypothetical protein ACOC0J_00740 [Myxococcota bacterium]
MSDKTFDFTTQVLPDLDGGVFAEKISRAVQETAHGVALHGDSKKRGKVIIELDLSRIGESTQIAVAHKLKYTKPTRRGKSHEEDTTETPLYVHQDGAVSIMPPDGQVDWLKTDSKEEA